MFISHSQFEDYQDEDRRSLCCHRLCQLVFLPRNTRIRSTLLIYFSRSPAVIFCSTEGKKGMVISSYSTYSSVKGFI